MIAYLTNLYRVEQARVVLWSRQKQFYYNTNTLAYFYHDRVRTAHLVQTPKKDMTLVTKSVV